MMSKSPEKNSSVDDYLVNGCGRCSLASSPACKVNSWRSILIRLRSLAIGCGLQEERKWGVPCYTHDGKNILLLGAFKEYASLLFVKGALLKDPHNILSKQTENVQSARQVRFTKLDVLKQLEPVLKEYIRSAIETERAGGKIAYKKTEDHRVPEELQLAFKKDTALKSAFNALTPGRQRGYLLYFAAPKQSKTRTARIEKSSSRILSGKGLHD